MSDTPRPTPCRSHSQQRQRRFLAALETAPHTLEELMVDQQVGRPQLVRWLARPKFRKALARRLAGVRRMGEVQRQLGARRALETLLKIVGDASQKPSDTQRRACLDVLKLTPPERRKSQADGFSSPMHPSVSPDRARELIDDMRADDDEPRGSD